MDGTPVVSFAEALVNLWGDHARELLATRYADYNTRRDALHRHGDVH